MARKKLSEFRGKLLLYSRLNVSYSGISVTPESNLDQIKQQLEFGKRYVMKVDQGVKGRKKKGLVLFDVTRENLKERYHVLKKKGFSYFIIEEFLQHEGFTEYYFAVQRTREGLQILYSSKGGIDIEENKESVQRVLFQSQRDFAEVSSAIGLPQATIEDILKIFDELYFSFLEINPLIVKNGEFYFLDTAVEVDSAGEFFVDSWGGSDFRSFSKRTKTKEELAVEELADKSQASFKLEIINPDGAIFVLLSGGGASVTIADEVYNLGKGRELANYGEYSGNPNEEETYIYTKNLLSLLLKSKAEKKVLIIGGGVANFTDVRVTFKGIINALKEVSDELHKSGVKVYVRRGGPYDTEGLVMMKKFLEKEKLFGSVHGAELVLTDVVQEAIKTL